MTDTSKLISVVTPCYNEKENIEDVYDRVKEIFQKIGRYRYEHIFIDNASTDGTDKVLYKLAGSDRNVKVIFNVKNFGHIRSPYHAIVQAQGDAVISFVADLQDPPSLIEQFISKWEQGSKIVIGSKRSSGESSVIFSVRRLYYWLIQKLSESAQVKNFTGFGLYDKKIVDILRRIEDPYPYFRGIVSEFGYDMEVIQYDQPKRTKGKTKNNFYTLYDMAMLGITSHSKIPLRLATFAGFVIGILSFLVSIGYLIYKLLFWQSFSLGIAPLIIGIFFLGAIQLVFIGIIGEYIGAVYTQVLKRPRVIERERVNFDQ